LPLSGKTRIGELTNFSLKVQKLASHSIVQTNGAPFIVSFIIGFAMVEKF
jgi:hypothetical protein